MQDSASNLAATFPFFKSDAREKRRVKTPLCGRPLPVTMTTTRRFAILFLLEFQDRERERKKVPRLNFHSRTTSEARWSSFLVRSSACRLAARGGGAWKAGGGGRPLLAAGRPTDFCQLWIGECSHGDATRISARIEGAFVLFGHQGAAFFVLLCFLMPMVSFTVVFFSHRK